MTSPPVHPGATPLSNRSPEKNAITDAEIAAESALQVIRDQLGRRMNTYTHPSRQINQIGLADWRCKESAQALTRLIGRAPSVLKVIRTELRKAFGVDPDSVLFTESGAPGVPSKVESLTQRALLLLVKPAVPINANQFTALSVKGDPSRRLPDTPLQVQQRVIALRLFERLSRAQADYWDSLARGSWLTRREHWVELNKELFADRAFMALQLDELSKTGMSMVQAVIDAPTAQARQRAGGDWASVKVGRLMWPGTPALTIPGALHFFREGDPSDMPHVIYLPGVVRNFYEYPSFVALQCGVLELHRALFHDLWQCLPLSRRNKLCRPADLSQASSVGRGLEVMGDALVVGAQALLSEQWNNELACAAMIYHAHVFSTQRPRPEPLDAALFLAHVEGTRKQLVGSARLGVVSDELLQWDQQRRSAEIIFASTAPGLALRTVEQQVKRYEKGLVALLDPQDPSAETPAYQQFVSQVNQLKVYTQTLKMLTQDAKHRLGEKEFWAERPSGMGTPRRGTLFMSAQTEALRCEVELQHRLKLLSTAHRDLVIEVVERPAPEQRQGSETQVLSIAVGSEPDAFYSLHNLWLVTTAAAVRVPARQRPVVLYVFGVSGGVTAFAGLDALTRSVKASLSSPDDSVLWGCVERDKRNDLRAHAMHGTLAVRYVPIDKKPVLASIEKLLGTYSRLLNSTEDITRIFSEVKDVELSRALLKAELEQQLEIPVNSALSQALANVELLRKAASEAKNCPAWLAQATRAQRTHFKRLQRVYLSGAFAFKTRLEHYLPDVGTFARRVLTARLREDGISPGFDIEQDFIDLPDDVQGSYCGYSSACSVGDRNITLTPSLTRTTFSLLQLVLHNMDPLAPWTRWRLNRARFLQPNWQQQLTVDYLLRMVSSLDIGGQYDALINKVFYPPNDINHTLSQGRIPELLNRALQAGFAHHLFAATQRGLSANAQSVFNTAMAARTPQDLLKNQHELQLCVIHLVGHTLQHDRYIAGIVVVHDKRSGLCVVYWPEAEQATVLTEYASLQQAHDALNRIGALPENLKRLARQIAPGWAFEAISHHPANADEFGQVFNVLDVTPTFFLVKGVWQGVEFIRSFRIKHLEPTALLDELHAQTLEQIASDPKGWLAIVATSHSDAKALLYRASVLGLQRQAQAASRSGKALQDYRARRLGEQSDTTKRRLVAFFSPLFGMFNDFYELLLVARRYHRFGDPRDAVDVGFMSGFMAIDLLSNFIPGPKKAGGTATRGVRPSLRSALGRIHRLRMTTSQTPRLAPSPVTHLNALERFRIKGTPEGAVALKGPGEKGVYVKSGEPFVADDTHHYPLYRRSNESSFRLKNKQAPGQDELILTIHQPREWLLGADAPQPVAGTSSGVLNPWHAPRSPSPDWQPPSPTATQQRILQSRTTDTGWLAWRTQVRPDQIVYSPTPGVFEVGAAPTGSALNARFLRVAPPNAAILGPDSGFYRMLPQGEHAPLTGISFITRDEPLSFSAGTDIVRWTSTDIGDQPIPVSRNPAGGWQNHPALFDRPLDQYVGEAFPTMTNETREFTVRRMIELSGSSRQVTASHMLGIRAALDSWVPPAPARPGQTDDLLRMLRPVQQGRQSTLVSYQGAAPGFERIDFLPSVAVEPRLQLRGDGVKAQRSLLQRTAVRTVLEQQGFTLQDFHVRRYRSRPGHESIAVHPNSPNRLYYISYEWLEMGHARLGIRFQNQWFYAGFKSLGNIALVTEIMSALREKRLVRILAGIHWPVRGKIAPSVYFIKILPLS
ncbi:hypothetical protein SAMN04490179_2697 [Pseudomonas antarctica]|uniref:Dermonecrotic toxin N-terminal domain-containing protein n=4 Tax=Pseudomonas antarctica TaxID=219572 RepID=A0A1G9YWB5_9PSED|nr:hypothetical protein PSAN_32770 [Pseudomonas antarctica]SDN13460.1 hypothetical protein SAMN04490179_2697 [Pseudomonas antarctica]